MKRLALSAALFVLCFTIAITGYCQIENGCKSMINGLENAGAAIKTNDLSRAKSQIDNVLSLWKSDRKVFGIFLEHETLTNLNSSITASEKLLDANNTEAAFEEIQSAISALRNISQEQKICIENIL